MTKVAGFPQSTGGFKSRRAESIEVESHLLAHSHGPGAKGDTLAKTLVPPRDRTAVAQPDVVTVHVVKRQRRQVVGARVRGPGR